jgi:hypothetical protein
MSVISTFTATPNRILITFEYLNSLGETGEDKKHLENQIHIGEKKKMVDEILMEMKNLDLIDSNRGKIKLKKELLKLSSTKIDLNNFLYEILLKKLTNDSEADECKQKELPSYLALLLCMNPYVPIEWSGDEFSKIKTKLVNQEIKLLENSKNDALLQNLVYWSKYLGFLSFITEKKYIPDPTNVLAKNLPSIIGSKKLAIDEFQSRLGAQIPVLEGGKVRNEIESKLNTEYQRAEAHFSRSTSFALKRLETRGVIKFEKVSDADNWVLDLGRVQDSVSHIEYKKGD